MKKFLTVLCLHVIFLNLSFATTYFVSTPLEIKTAMSTAQPGDTLLMENGVWTDARIVFQGNGEADNPILLRAETPGYVILNGIANLRIVGTHLVVDGLRFVGGRSISGAVIEFRKDSNELSHHCRLTNTAIIDYNPSNSGNDYKWVSIYGTHNRVDHCYFEGKNNSGTTLVVWFERTANPSAHNHLIDSNYFAYRPPLGYNGGETIRIGTSTYSMNNSNTIVENNYFEHCNGEIEIISNKSCENIYRHNTFYECEGALTLRHGNRCTVEGNFFIGNRMDLTGGVRVIGEDHKVINNYFEGLYGSSFKSALPILNGVPNSPLNRYFQVKNALIAFNTFVDCRYSMIIGAGSDNERTLPPENCTIANNVVLTDFRIIRQDDEPINMTWEGNIMEGSSLGIPQPEGIELIDPQLYLADDGLWRPDSIHSPVIGAAQGEYPFIIEDMDGHDREIMKDVGADQYSAEPIIYRPLTAADVGPFWMSASVPVILSLEKSGSGTIIADPPGGIYQSGTEVNLIALPDTGWKFVGWEGDLSGTEDTLSITMVEDITIRAVFEEDVPTMYALTVFVFSSGGSVALDPPGGSYLDSTMVTLTAIPDSGWEFVTWDGDLTGSNNPDSIFMDSDKMINTIFRQLTDVERLAHTPFEFSLNQNYPNPFNSTTNISFSIGRANATSVKIYDIVGREVASLIDGFLDAGSYNIQFDASGLESGLYFYKIKSGEFHAVKKMIITK